MTRWHRLTALLLMLALVVPAAVPAAASAYGVAFQDVVATPYETAVGTLWKLGIVNGISPTLYGTRNDVTRAQMAALLVRTLGKADLALLRQGQSSFSDVPGQHWASGSIAVAVDMNLARGDGVRFRPDDPVTFAEAVTMIIRAAGQESLVTGEWPVGHVVMARQLGLLEGTGFELNANAPRGDIALMLYAWVFKVPHPATGKTLNQTFFRLPASVAITPEGDYLPRGRVRVGTVVRDVTGRELDLAANITDAAGRPVVDRGFVTVPAGVDTFSLRATVGEAVANKTYKIVTGLKLEPASAVVAPGGTVQLQATATLANNTRVSVSPAWEVQGAATAEPQGLVRVANNAAGNVFVTASLGELTASATIAVNTTLDVAPGNPAVAPGGTQTFTATLPGGGGVSGVTWTATAGAIDANGRWTAPAAPGTYAITARAGGASGTVQAVVPSSITIDPPSVALNPQGTQTFKAYATVGGRQVPVSVNWSISGSPGAITTDGVFTAGQPGATGDVVASAGTLRATARVTVAGTLNRLAIGLDDAALPADGTSRTKVTVRLVDQNGNVVPTDGVLISFTVAGGLATLTQSQVTTQRGVAQAEVVAGSTAGQVTVQAQALTATGVAPVSAIINLITAARPPAKVRLAVFPPQVATGSVAQAVVSATVVDATGTPVPATGPVAVSLAQVSLPGVLVSQTISIPQGSMTGTANLIMTGTPGTVYLSGSAGALGVEGSYISAVPGTTPNRLLLQATPNRANNDGVSAIGVDVAVADSAGVALPGAFVPAGTLTVTGPGGTTNQALTFANGMAHVDLKQSVAGTYTLRAISSSGSTSLISPDVTVTFGTTGGTGGSGSTLPGHSLEVVASPTSVTLGGTATVTVRVKDQAGQQAITDTGRTIILASTSGVTITPTSQTTVAGQATFTVTGTAAGTYTLTAFTSGLPGSNTAQGTLMVGSSGGSGVAYKIRLVPTSTSVPLFQSTLVTAQVVDNGNNLITTDNGRTITLTVPPGVVATSTTAVTSGGQATFVLNGTTNISATLLATSTGLLASEPVVIVFGAGGGGSNNAAKVRLVAGQTSLVAGQVTTLTAQVTDVYGNIISSDAGRTVTLNAPSGVTALSNSGTSVSGQVFFTVFPTQGGSFVLTAQSAGLITSDPVTLTVAANTPGAAAVLGSIMSQGTAAVGTPVTLSVYVADVSGRVVFTDTGRQVSVTITGGSGTVAAQGGAAGQTAIASTVNGVATFTLTGTASGSLVFTAGSTGVGGTANSLTVTTGGTGGTGLVIRIITNTTVKAGQQFAAFPWVYDSLGNALSLSVPVTLILPTGITVVGGGSTTVNTMGTITLQVASHLANTTQTINGTATGYTVQPASVQITAP